MALWIRTALFVPANRPDRVEKALRSEADAIIIDLEDSVPPPEKAKARATIRQKAPLFEDRTVIIRVNPLPSPFFQGDIMETALREVRGFMLPKVEKGADLEQFNQVLLEVERGKGLPEGHFLVLPLIESAASVQCADEILSIHTTPDRCYTAAFGAADYTLDLGIEMTREGAELLYPRSRIAIACRAAGLAPPIDTPFMIDLFDEEALTRDAARARGLGFQGKLVVHPRQIEPCNRIFSPSSQEVAKARKIVDAFEIITSGGAGAAQLDGLFIDLPVVTRAKRLLSLAEKIGLMKPDNHDSTHQDGNVS